MDMWCPPRGADTISSLLETIRAMRWAPRVAALGPAAPRPAGHRSRPHGQLWEYGESRVLSEPQCLHVSHGTTGLYLQGGGLSGPVVAHSRSTANPVNGFQWLHRSQKPTGK